MRIFAVTLLCFTVYFLSSAQTYDMELFEGMKPRNIGPAGMSGRVTAVDVVRDNKDIIYVGTASGGLWKSEGGGVVWKPIFDEEKAASIGAIAISPHNSDEIWVGTGEGNPRNSQSSGYGVFRSLDGGQTWEHMGLEKTRNIHRIFVHTNDPKTIIVGAQGSAWGDSEDRGVFRSQDGGKTWTKILFVNNRTGVADMTVDPTNPNKMVVGMWEFRRWPWFFKSGGQGSGLYITYDGGDTWKLKTHEDGLPHGEIGKIGLAIAPSNPKVIYALIESKKNALYKTEDGGAKWTKVQDKDIGDRPFYYADIAVDPINENRVYNVFSNVKMSIDGGKTFKTLLGWDRVHGDHHFWYIHPDDPSFIIDGNDGGMAISRDRGETWRFIENLPVAQFYHIQYDMETPYNVLGGMQDNGSWRGPSWVWRKGGIRNGYWEEIAFGDGFDVVVDENSDRFGYGMSQGGALRRLDFETGASKFIRPTHPDGVPLRFNWNAAIEQDPKDKKTVYYGSQFLHKSSDNGVSWEVISPDLTTNDPEKQKQTQSGGLTFDATGAENFTTIVSIAASPRENGVIWVGTDDGNIQVTRDGGQSWKNVGGIKDLPKGCWVTQVHASQYNDGEAFAVINDYRRDNWTPYLYKTTNYGKSWKRLVDENDVWGYSLSFVQDLEESNLLFLGTEFGLYVSFDGGNNWNKWAKDYPTVSTMDLKIHPRDHDLIIGTFGRSAWVIDDIRPLREMAQKGQEIWAKKIHTFQAPDAIIAHYKQASGTRFHADAMFLGENRPYGALITFYLKDLKAPKASEDGDTPPALKTDTLTVKVLDNDGKHVRKIKVAAKKGVNRFNWFLDRKGVRSVGRKKPKREINEPAGPAVLPGTYTVWVHYDGDSSSTTVNVKNDPRLDINDTELKSADVWVQRLLDDMTTATQATDRLYDAKDFMKKIAAEVKEDKTLSKEVKEKNKALTKQVNALMEIFIAPEKIQGIYRNPALISSQLQEAGGYLQGPFGPLFSRFGTPNPVFYPPSDAHKLKIEQMEASLKEALAQVNDFLKGDWKVYTDYVNSLDLKLVKEYEEVSLD